MAKSHRLRELFEPFVTPGLDLSTSYRFHDAPPTVVREALDDRQSREGVPGARGCPALTRPPADNGVRRQRHLMVYDGTVRRRYPHGARPTATGVPAAPHRPDPAEPATAGPAQS